MYMQERMGVDLGWKLSRAAFNNARTVGAREKPREGTHCRLSRVTPPGKRPQSQEAETSFFKPSAQQ